MHLLCFWESRNHLRDINYGASYHLNQKNKLLHEVNIGESVWPRLQNQKCVGLKRRSQTCARVIKIRPELGSSRVKRN